MLPRIPAPTEISPVILAAGVTLFKREQRDGPPFHSNMRLPFGETCGACLCHTESSCCPKLKQKSANLSSGRISTYRAIVGMDTTVEPKVLKEWLEEFEAAARRPLEQRVRYAFIRTYKPVLDDAPFRAFDTMEEYRQWCEKNLPDWLGYGRV